MSEKIKKPIYKKWWFWLIVFFVIVGAIGGTGEEEEQVTKEKTEAKEDKPKEQTKKEEQPKKEDATPVTKEVKEETPKQEEKPKQEPVKPALKMDEEGFFADIDTLSKESNGIIIAARKSPYHDGYQFIEVVISDAWYNSPKHEQERFANMVAKTVEVIVKNRELVEKSDSIIVDLVDTYGKTIAEEGIWSGEMKIKE